MQSYFFSCVKAKRVKNIFLLLALIGLTASRSFSSALSKANSSKVHDASTVFFGDSDYSKPVVKKNPFSKQPTTSPHVRLSLRECEVKRIPEHEKVCCCMCCCKRFWKRFFPIKQS